MFANSSVSKFISMKEFPSIELQSLLVTEDDDQSEYSQVSSSHNSNNVNSKVVLNLTKSTATYMDTIEEEHVNESSQILTNAYEDALSVLLPVMICELKFLEYLFAFKNDEERSKQQSNKMLNSMFNFVEQEFLHMIDKVDKNNHFHTLQLLVVTERVLHTYREYCDFIAKLLMSLHTALTLKWNKFISDEILWIYSLKKFGIKQKGVLPPIKKFPAFCNHMFDIVKRGDSKASYLTNIDIILPSHLFEYKDGTSELKMDDEYYSSLIEEKHAMIFGESEQVTNTMHKMITALFHWLDGTAKLEPKYTAICLVENYHYFYYVFSKQQQSVITALREHVLKAKKRYEKYRRIYVREGCVQYECRTLTEYWITFNSHLQQTEDFDTISVYLPLIGIRNICVEFLSSEKKLQKIVENMFKRLKKHLGENDILFTKIWRKIAEYFTVKYKKFKENVEKIYMNVDHGKYLMFESEFVWNLFIDQYRNTFGNISAMDDQSSARSSVSANSHVSGFTAFSNHSGKSMRSVGSKTSSKKAKFKFSF